MWQDGDITAESVDLMDTAEDMAESISDVPAKDIKSKDDTTKVLGETVFKDGVEDMEELEAEDPFLEQPMYVGCAQCPHPPMRSATHAHNKLTRCRSV